MKKLSTLFAMLFLSFGIANAENAADDNLNRGYSNSFIFTEGGIEFAIFPDGQFDFNFLDNGPGFGANVNVGNVNVSFNTGFDYDPYVQYDTYGAVIQIENTPIYYDSYGRIIQAGDVFVNYRNGYVRNVGNLYVNYSRPGIILNYTGFINVYNRNYIYQPWHGYYATPFVNRCIVYSSPYRTYYNPIRFSYSYHRNYWNTPSYYNGHFADNRNYRSFYRPNDRVNYRDYERGRRDNRGRAIASNRQNDSYRKNIASGRQSIARSSESRSAGRSFDRDSNSRTAIAGRNNSKIGAVSDRSNGNTRTAGRTSSNNRSNSATTRSNGSNRETNKVGTLSNRTTNTGVIGRTSGNNNRSSTSSRTSSRGTNNTSVKSNRQPTVDRSTRTATTRSNGNSQRTSRVTAPTNRTSRPTAKSAPQQRAPSNARSTGGSSRSNNSGRTSSNRRGSRGE